MWSGYLGAFVCWLLIVLASAWIHGSFPTRWSRAPQPAYAPKHRAVVGGSHRSRGRHR